MASSPKQLRPEHARAEATHHRGRAADLIRQASLPDLGDNEARDMHHQANSHVAAAERLENKAQEPQEHVNQHEPQVGEPAEHARANEDRARAWYLPGSVATGDKLQQIDEAQQESLMGQMTKYAARGLADRDGKAVSFVADGASQATKDTVSAAQQVGKGAAQVTGQALSATSEAAKETGRGMVQAATTAINTIKAATTDVKATEVDAHKAQHQDPAAKNQRQQEPAKNQRQQEPAKNQRQQEPAKNQRQQEPAKNQRQQEPASKTAQKQAPLKAAPTKAQEAKARDLVKRHSPPKRERKAPAKGRER